jgi:copper homeostasis protein
MTVLEICVDSVESAIAAERGGAQRVELCSDLTEGGLTPSLGLIRTVRSRIGIGVHVMIRPRAGDFLYSEDDFAVMRDDISAAAKAGADGVVLGLLTADGDVDVERTKELVKLARPMEVTFHRAIDMARDVEDALEEVIETGADRILTSGAEPTAMQGRHRIRELVRASKGRVGVMVGSGIRAENVQEIAETTGAVEFHAALRRAVPSPIRHQRRKVHLGDPGVDDYARRVVRTADVRSLQAAIDTVFNHHADAESTGSRRGGRG